METYSTESHFDTEAEKMVCLKGRPCIFQPGNFTGWGSDGVKHHRAAATVAPLIGQTFPGPKQQPERRGKPGPERERERKEEEEVTWCFTPSQPVRFIRAIRI